MSPSEEIDQAMKMVEGAWTPRRAALGADRLRRRQAQRRSRRVLGVVMSGALAGAAAVALLWGRGADRPASDGVESGQRLRLTDGTTAVATSRRAELRVAEDTPARQVVRIVRGGARFDVPPLRGRLFRVELRDVAVEVMGTVFRVEQREDLVRVAVERGRVRVIRGSQRFELGAGETTELPSAEVAPRAAAIVVPLSMPSAPAPGRTSGAAEERRSAGLRERPDDRIGPEELLGSYESARQTGRPDDAVRALRTMIARFPRDARAPLAAFTLGRIELEERRRPVDAAQAFALAQRLAPAGEMVEDALAREVQAWHDAGEAEAAHQRALEYVRRYPHGRRISAVKRLGSLP